MDEEYIIYLLDHDAVCPVCKGMLRFLGACFPCNDCHRVFDICGYMKYDRQIKVKEIRPLEAIPDGEALEN